VTSASANPVELLQQLESESLGIQFAEESDTASGESWRGFVFRLDELNLVVPFLDGFEVVPCKDLSPLPLAKSWIKGLTNIRGGRFIQLLIFLNLLEKNRFEHPRGVTCSCFPIPA